MTNDPAGTLILCLLSSEPLTWDASSLRAELGHVELLPEPEPGAAFQVVHENQRAEMPGSAPQPPTAVVVPLATVDGNVVAKALQQTWDWPAARQTIETCGCSTFVTDRFARHLGYKERWRLLRQTTAALLRSAMPRACNRAILAPQAQRLIEPEPFLQGQQPGGDHLCGVVNVRLFKVADHGEGCLMMDTLGLSVLGLPDLQCVFRGIDPDEVAALLWDYAYYVFEKGDVIADGETIKGLKTDDFWTCGRQESLVEPRRVVLDIYPGPEHGPE